MLIRKQFSKQNLLTIKNINGVDADVTQSMFLLKILEKIKETRLKSSQGSVTVLYEMINYQEKRVKLTNTQLSKLKSEAKNETGTTLRITKKDFQDE